MHRAKHRAAGRPDAQVRATDLVERFGSSSGSRRGVALLDAPASDHEADPASFDAASLDAASLDPADFDAAPFGDSVLFGAELFGGLSDTSQMRIVPDDEEIRVPAPLFRGNAAPAQREGSPFGAGRHSRPRLPHVPVPRVPAPLVERTRPQPLGTAISVTVLGAAAAVTSVVVPAPSGIETTGSMTPVQQKSAPAPAAPLGQAVAAPAPAPALPDQPTLQINNLVNGVKAQMATENFAPAALPSVATPFTTVASTTALASSPAAVRRAALTNALAKLGKPYRWGAVGPNAFDCSGLVKYAFGNAGRSLPRTSRAMASVGTPVSRANLQPGDLVFFYQPISHVGIYIGNNKIVHASQTGQPVKISDITYMRFTTARRV